VKLRETLKNLPGVRRAVGRVRGLGAKFACPVCGERVAAFRPLGKQLIENQKKHGWPYTPEDAETINPAQYTCPHCAASDLYLNERLAKSGKAGTELLEFAPHPAMRGFFARLPGVAYRTADLFMPDVDDRVDITHMGGYPDDLFDVFICSHVLEHVPDDRQAMAELLRILKPGGWGILMVPVNLAAKKMDEDPTVTDEAERWRRFGQGDHVRLYTKAGFVERLRDAGFTIHQYGQEHFGAAAFARHGIAPRSVLYVVEKPVPAGRGPSK